MNETEPLDGGVPDEQHDVDVDQPPATDGQEEAGDTTKKCPHCLGDIPAEASRCQLCGARQNSVPWAKITGVACLVAVAGVIVAMMLRSAGVETPVTPRERTITGSFTLIDSDIGSAAGTCWGTGGYNDIEEGLQIIVKDGTGKTIANSALGRGVEEGGVTCKFPVKIERVPDSDFYAIEVGRRGSQTYKRADLEARGWTVDFTLG